MLFSMRFATAFVTVLVLAAGLMTAPAQEDKKGGGKKEAPRAPGLTLTSPAFTDGGEIPDEYTQASEKPVSPLLEWTNVPDGTLSFALIFHDPDVALRRTTEDVLHWLVFNIPGDARQLPRGMPATPVMPDGTIQGKNVSGQVGYRGPGAPAPGPHHHYTFELFALDTKLDLKPDATRDDLLKAIDGKILAKAVVVGRFHRK
jgi:hypothetical protein